MYFKKITPKITGFKAMALHHFYSGLLIAVFAFTLIFQLDVNPLKFYSIFILGLWMALDDVLQHLVQRHQIKTLGYYDVVSFWNWWPNQIKDWIINSLKKM